MIPHVERGKLITAARQNDLIDKVNEHDESIEELRVGAGDPDAVQGLIDTSLYNHINDQTPHPVYDDILSLTVLFENGLCLMALSPNITSVITRIATEFKTFRTQITGNASGSLSGLTTTAKGNLVEAINEVNAATAEGAGIDDQAVSSTTTWSSQKTSTELAGKAASVHTHVTSDITGFDAAVTGLARAEIADWVGTAPETLDTIGEIAEAIENNQDAISALQTIGSEAVRFTSQSLTTGQQTQARTNIGAASAADLTTLTNNVGNTDADFVATFNAGLA